METRTLLGSPGMVTGSFLGFSWKPTTFMSLSALTMPNWDAVSTGMGTAPRVTSASFSRWNRIMSI